MSWIFTPEARWLWGVALGSLLFFPVRRLIFVLSVRRYQAVMQGSLPDKGELNLLRRRVSIRSALICYIFALFYVIYVAR